MGAGSTSRRAHVSRVSCVSQCGKRAQGKWSFAIKCLHLVVTASCVAVPQLQVGRCSRAGTGVDLAQAALMSSYAPRDGQAEMLGSHSRAGLQLAEHSGQAGPGAGHPATGDCPIHQDSLPGAPWERPHGTPTAVMEASTSTHPISRRRKAGHRTVQVIWPGPHST